MLTTDRPIICSFESRRSIEMSSLIERHGGRAISAPSMRELPIEDNPEAVSFIRNAIADRYPFMVLLTGVGTTALMDVAESQGLAGDLKAAFARATLIIRGPKPAAVLAKLGLKAAVRAPEPNTWKELLAAIESSEFSLRGQLVAVQEYGVPNQRLYDGLKQLGAIVTAVPVYRWALPEDTAPLEAALHRIAAGTVNVVMFTSANQVHSVLGIAEQLGLQAALRERLCSGSVRVASIGPTCSEALVDQGLPVHGEASPPKMGQLVQLAMELAGHALDAS